LKPTEVGFVCVDAVSNRPFGYQIVVEKHHGEIKCLSKPGEGTEFLIKIPTDN
jgi:hypothetical protein